MGPRISGIIWPCATLDIIGRRDRPPCHYHHERHAHAKPSQIGGGLDHLSQGTHLTTVAEQPAAVAGDKISVSPWLHWAPNTIRCLVAVGVAAVITFVTGRSLPAQLAVRTDIVGYPVHSNYNIERVMSIYFLIVLVFPALSLLLYVSLGEASRRLGLPSGSPVQLPPPAEPAALEALPGRDNALMAGAARAVAVGVSFGLEVAVARDATTVASFWFTIAFVGVAYAAVVMDLAFLLHMAVLRVWTPTAIVSALNALAAPLTLTGLLAVSAVTSVTVSADHSVHRYPWLPGWVALVATGLLLLWIGARIAHAQDGAIPRVERLVVLLVSAPVCLFVLTSALPSALGPINMFEDGQTLVGAQLTLEGYVPWRDSLPIHGLLQDQLSAIPGILLFGDSLWGATAGRTLLLNPLAYVFLFVFAAIMFERSWATVVAFMAITLAGVLSAAHPGAPTSFPLLIAAVDTRFMFWPLVLVLMKVALDRAAGWPTAVLGAILVAWVALVPESAYGLAAVGIVVVLRDLYLRERGQPLWAAFSQTLRLTAGGAVLALVVAAYLLIEGALGDFFRFYLNNVPGHELAGGLPVDPRTWLTDRYFAFAAISPVAAVLLTFWYLSAAFLGRRRLGTLDWVMASAGILTLLYYTKFLGRADLHVLQSYAVAVPLIGLLTFQLYRAAERALAGVRPGAWLVRQVTRQPIALVLLGAALLGTGRVLLDQLPLAATHVRTNSLQEPMLSRIGYSMATPDLATYDDVDTVLRAYLRPGDWVFDFSNDPAYYYYLLEREPRTKYFHVSLAINEAAQQDLISELKRNRPKLVVFTTDRYGLPEWDGIPNTVRHYDVSQYILDNYWPLLSIRGQILYADASAGLSPALAQRLHLREAPITDDLPFRGQACDWGAAPNFLTVSPPSRERGLPPVTLATPASKTGIAMVSGWAVDSSLGAPPREVVIVSGDRVVGRSPTNVDRPDVATARHHPQEVRSGFQIAVPGVLPGDALEARGLRVFGISGSGIASELDYGPAVVSQFTSREPMTRLDLGDGTTTPVRPDATEGFVDQVTKSYLIQIATPPNATWADYRWLEIDARDGGVHADMWTVSDRLVSTSQRQVTFETLAGSPKTFKVYIGSCSQWHGYTNTLLNVTHEQSQEITAIRLLP
jgi:hypothetical protein